MNKLTTASLCQLFFLVVLLIATVMSALPYFLLALALLVVMVYVTLRPVPSRLKTAVTISAIFLLPPLLVPLLGHLTLLTLTTIQVISAISIIPAIYVLDNNLKQDTQHIAEFTRFKKGRNITVIFMTLLTLILSMLFVSFVLNNLVLLFTAIIVALYLLATTINILFTIPRLLLDSATIKKRVIAGTTVDINLDISGRTHQRIYCFIEPADYWVKVNPRRFVLTGNKMRISLSFIPPLAGPSHLRLQLSAIDSRGLIQVNQLLEPVELHVIPRAKYAEWLATKYLEQTGVNAAAPLPSDINIAPRRGIEYFESRDYQPGDQLKNIDWKHTLKLNQMIIKEYVEAGEKAAIIAVNLAVTGAEEADRLAFNLITTALTLARDNIPAALAAYNHERVVLTTDITHPTETLNQALSLIKEITRVIFSQRHLQPPDIAQLKRNINHLRQVKSEPAQRLLNLLDFEYRAIEENAKNHPATTALSQVTRHAPAPAMIALVSELNHDTEALLITTEKLSRRDFTTVSINEA
ncbi:DUF58 domain-containing protein [Chloroflexota bacterium]